jgi:hypothetical protein
VALVAISQVAANPKAETGLLFISGLLVVVIIAAFVLHRLDRVTPARGLSDEDKQAVLAALVQARDRVAATLVCPKDHCRANVFGMNPLKRLQIVDSLTVNMDRVQEWAISMPPGRGATGIVWITKQPKVLIAPFENDEDLDRSDAARVDPQLEWIISVPVRVDDAVKWVVNVDGRDKRDLDQVEAAVPDVEWIETVIKPQAKAA